MSLLKTNLYNLYNKPDDDLTSYTIHVMKHVKEHS